MSASTDHHPSPRRAAAPAHPLATLTRRERQIFDLTIAGRRTRELAQELGISARTVETHRCRVLRKLGAHNAVELMRLAAGWGLQRP